MKPYILPIVFQILGFLVIMAEIFVPSLGLLTVIALGLLFYSIYLAFTTISSVAGMVFVGIDLLALPLMLIWGVKLLAISPLALKTKLASSEGVVSQAPDGETYLKKQGRSLTDLRPSGTAYIDGQRLDVVTDGEYIDANTPVLVTQVTGNQIIVEKLNE